MKIQIVLVYVLYHIGEYESVKKWRLCPGRYKQRKDPLGDNRLNQPSLYRYRDNNTNMVRYLQDFKYIQWERIRDVMLKVDRKDFVYHMPYEDIPKHLGYCSWTSSPHTIAHILDLCFLNLHRGAKVLEIGSGSGYLATLMAHMVGPKGHVTGLEHIMDICIESIANISTNNFDLIENQTIDIIHKDGRNGHEEGGPYDCIIASCAFPEWPAHIEKQLSLQGRMVVPIGKEGEHQSLEVLNILGRGSRHSFKTENYVSFEPCVSEKEQLDRWKDAQIYPGFHFATPVMY